MVSMILTLLSSAWFPLDLSAHQDALILAGNLLAGIGPELKHLAVGKLTSDFICTGTVCRYCLGCPGSKEAVRGLRAQM